MSIFINWVNFGLSNKIIFPVVDPKVIWFGSEWLNFTRDHFGSVKVTLLSGTYFVSVNLYSSDTYLIIYGTLNDILTKHFRRNCTFDILPWSGFLPRPGNFFRGQSWDNIIKNTGRFCYVLESHHRHLTNLERTWL